MNIYDTREGARLVMNRERKGHWNRWGPFLTERAWGTVREDYSADGNAWSYFPARSGSLARLSVERRWHSGYLRPAPIFVFCAGALERPRSDPQGAAVWFDQQRGQPRRRRQGVLLLPGQHADALVHEVSLQISAGGIPVRKAPRRRTGGEPSSTRNMSWLTPESSTRAAILMSSSNTPRPSRKIY